MGRHSTGVYLYDELKSLSIADLKRFGYLQPGTRSGVISWTARGRTSGRISVSVRIGGNHGLMELSYICNDEYPIKYNIPLNALPTNLGMGRRWYFTCTRTGKCCTKLFMADYYFQHRDGIPGAMYYSQTRSHFSRALDKVWNAHDGLYRRYMKWHYRGKPTKRYLRALQANRAAEPEALAFLRRWE